MGLTSGLAVLAAVQVSLFQAAPGRSSQLTPSAAPGELTPPVASVDAPAPQLPRMPVTWRLGPQRPDLIRYNRVEGLSLGARLMIRPRTAVGPVSIIGTARLGSADLHPNGRVDLEHESLDRRVDVAGYHELASIDDRARHFGDGNSLSGVLWGQEDGDYFRRSGVSVEVTPPSARPRSYTIRAYADYHQGVDKETDFHVPRLWDDGRRLRANIEADEGWEVGASAELTSRSGTDRTRPRGEIRAFGQAAAGAHEFARVSVGADVALPLPGRLEVLLAAEGGASWGSPSAQRLWYVGGPTTLRGYGPRVLGGGSFGRARAELSRSFGFGRLILFSDAAWAGEVEQFRFGRTLQSAGAGIAVGDGLARFDGAWRLEGERDFRFDMYLREPL